jgi:hypothetical protein
VIFILEYVLYACHYRATQISVSLLTKPVKPEVITHIDKFKWTLKLLKTKRRLLYLKDPGRTAQ